MYKTVKKATSTYCFLKQMGVLVSALLLSGEAQFRILLLYLDPTHPEAYIHVGKGATNSG